jgi:hypothetical protein
MKGARFADVAAIQERMTAVVRSILKEAFADSFQKLYERCQQCVVLFVFWYHSPNFLNTPRIYIYIYIYIKKKTLS